MAFQPLVRSIRDNFGVLYQVIPSPGNGLCGYSAISSCVTGNAHEVTNVIEDCMSAFNKNPVLFLQQTEFGKKNSNLTSYMSSLRQAAADVDRQSVPQHLWLEDGHLLALARLYNITIFVFNSVWKRWLSYNKSGIRGYICLHFDGSHFDVLHGEGNNNTRRPPVPRHAEPQDTSGEWLAPPLKRQYTFPGIWTWSHEEPSSNLPPASSSATASTSVRSYAAVVKSSPATSQRDTRSPPPSTPPLLPSPPPLPQRQPRQRPPRQQPVAPAAPPPLPPRQPRACLPRQQPVVSAAPSPSPPPVPASPTPTPIPTPTLRQQPAPPLPSTPPQPEQESQQRPMPPAPPSPQPAPPPQQRPPPQAAEGITMGSSHRGTVSSFSCVACVESFSSQKALRMHQYRKHRSPVSHQEEASSVSQHTQQLHQTSLSTTHTTQTTSHNTQDSEQHTSCRTRTHTCSICTKYFYSANALRTHTQRSHPKPGPTKQKCPQCNKFYVNLQNHRRCEASHLPTKLVSPRDRGMLRSLLSLSVNRVQFWTRSQRQVLR